MIPPATQHALVCQKIDRSLAAGVQFSSFGPCAALAALAALLALGAAACRPAAAPGRPMVDVASGGERPDTLVLTGATVIDGTGRAPMPNATVVVAGGTIAAVFPAGTRPMPPGARVVHLGGRYIVPGLIDSHVHVTYPFTTAPRQDSILKLLFQGGVTAVRDLAGDAVALRELARAAAEPGAPWPRIHYSALFASDSFLMADGRVEPISHGMTLGQAPWARAIGVRTDVRLAVEVAKWTGATGIKIYAGLPRDVVRALADEAHRQQMMVWAHSSVLPALPSDVVAVGVDVLSHADVLVLDAETDRPLATRDYGRARRYDRFPVTSEPITRLLEAMKSRGTILDATLYVTTAQHRRFGADTTRRHLWPMAEWTYAVTRRAHQMGIRVAAGTDLMGQPGTDSLPFLHDELELLVTRAGFSPMDAIVAATLRGAEALGTAERYGTVEPGKIADLVVLRADPLADIRNSRTITHIVKAGRVHERSWPGTLERDRVIEPQRESRVERRSGSRPRSFRRW
jgi:imidazolonepropionase-like amidohydrolase